MVLVRGFTSKDFFKRTFSLHALWGFFFSKKHFSCAGQKQGARLDEHFSLESLTSAFNNGTQTR